MSSTPTSYRIAQVNRHLQRVFGEIVQREARVADGVLITISRVDTAPNMKNATIWLYIQPAEQAESVLTELSEQLYELQGALNRALDRKPCPRVALRIDHGAEHANQIDHHLKELHESEDS